MKNKEKKADLRKQGDHKAKKKKKKSQIKLRDDGDIR